MDNDEKAISAPDVALTNATIEKSTSISFPTTSSNSNATIPIDIDTNERPQLAMVKHSVFSRYKFWRDPDKARFVRGVSAFVVGLGLVMIGIIAYIGGPIYFQNKINEAIVVDAADPSSDSYLHWVSNNYSGAPPVYSAYTMWNLTNVDEVLQGGTPNLSPVGPYYYRKYETKLNITFSENDEVVSFLDYIPLFYDNSSTSPALNPATDMITNINPIYIVLLFKFGGDLELAHVLIGPVMNDIMIQMNTTYLSMVIDTFFPPLLLSLSQDLVEEINQTASDNMLSWEIFCQIWSNATSDPSNYPGFNSTMRLSTNGISSDISMQSCIDLFNVTVPNSLTNNESYAIWFGAESGDTNSTITLSLIFTLSLEQIQMILDWRESIKTQLFNSQICKMNGVDNIHQLQLKQWSDGNVSPMPIQYYLPSMTVTPEYFFWSQSANMPVEISFEDSLVLWTGPYALSTLAMSVQFLLLVQSGSWNAINNVWGLNENQSIALALYLTTYMQPNFVYPFMRRSGLFVTRSVNDWLWYGNDSIVMLLSPQDAASNLAVNDTSPEEAQKTKLTNTLYTGIGDVNLIDQYILYEGRENVTVWASLENVSGTEGTQFSPDVHDQNLLVWSPELLRSLVFDYLEDTSIYDLTLLRYVLSPSVMAPNPKFFQTIQGFANISGLRQGAPVYVCKSNMYQVDPFYIAKINGMQPDPENDEITLDVEPYTGASM